MDVGPIPWIHIHTYAVVARLEEEMIKPFIDIIRAMDTAYQKWIADKKDKK